jgi:hypothetical protein
MSVQDMPVNFIYKVTFQMEQRAAFLAFQVEMLIAALVLIYIPKAGAGNAIYGISAHLAGICQLIQMPIDSSAADRGFLLFKVFHNLRGGDMPAAKRSDIRENSRALPCVVTD